MRQNSRQRPGAGFSLIELLIAVVILGIVLGIAIPNYRQWVIESARAEGKTTLFQVAQTLERCFTRFSAYNDDACGVGDGAPIDSEGEKYQVSIAATPTTFLLTATPQGGQTEDTECLNLTLASDGTRGVSGSGTVTDCW